MKMKMKISAAAEDGKKVTKRKSTTKESVRIAFQTYDQDASGQIDRQELRHLIKDLGGFLHEKEFQKALEILDKDQDGMIDFKEFLTWWEEQKDDLDGDGNIGELEKTLARLKETGQERFHVDVHTAAWQGQLELLERLLQEDSEFVNAKDTTEFGDMNTPLHYAAYQGHTQLCKTLIENGANVNIMNQHGCTALFFAAQQSRVEVVALLLQNGADIRLAEKKHRYTPVDVCTCPDVFKLFQDIGGSPPSTPSPPVLVESTSTELKVIWKTPPTQLNEVAPISAYKIKVTKEKEGTSVRVVLVPAFPMEAHIDQLAPSTSYVVQIAAINLHGVGEYSAFSNALSTLKAKPSAPRLEVIENTGKSVLLQWSRASQEDVVNYYILQQSIGSEGEIWKQVVKTDGAVTNFAVENLFSDCRYLFRVAGVNESGRGDFSTPIAVHTLDDERRNGSSSSSNLQARLRQSSLKMNALRAFSVKNRIANEATEPPTKADEKKKAMITNENESKKEEGKCDDDQVQEEKEIQLDAKPTSSDTKKKFVQAFSKESRKKVAPPVENRQKEESKAEENDAEEEEDEHDTEEEREFSCYHSDDD